MKKKALTAVLALSSLVLSTNALADCGYVDHLSITHANIAELGHVGALTTAQKTRTTFDIIGRARDKDGICTAGLKAEAKLRVEKNASSACNLTIKDGPFMWNPEVSAVICVGDIQYNGISKNQGYWGNARYTLYFS